MGFAVLVCGHPALQVRVSETGQTQAGYCNELNPDDLCRHWAPWPPKSPAPEPVVMYEIEAPAWSFPVVLVVGVLILAAAFAVLFGLK